MSDASQNFVLNNFYAKKGITRIHKIALENLSKTSFGAFFQNKNISIVFVQKPIERLQGTTDLVIVQNNAFRNIEAVQQAFLPEQKVIFDNTNKPYLMKILSEHLPENHYSVSQRGAYIAFLSSL